MFEYEDQALLNAVYAAPDDDMPRLLYADWLEERDATVKCERCHGMRLKLSDAKTNCDWCNGRGERENGNLARAKFIRRQIANPTVGAQNPVGFLTPPLNGMVPTYFRGFIEQVNMLVRQFEVFGTRLLWHYPTIRRVVVTDRSPYKNIYGRYAFWKCPPGNVIQNTTSSSLPEGVFDRLNGEKGTELSEKGSRVYLTETGAYLDQHRAFTEELKYRVVRLKMLIERCGRSVEEFFDNIETTNWEFEKVYKRWMFSLT